MPRPLTLPLVLVPLAFVLTGCALITGPLKLEQSRLMLESGALHDLQQTLSDPDFPPGARHIALTVSYAAINQILAGAKNLSYPLPTPRGTVLHVDKIQVIPQDGTPMLALQAYATKGTVRLDLDLLAFLVLDEHAGPAPVLRVRVKDLKPYLSWTVFRHLLLAHTLATYEADSLALNRLAFTVPIEQVLALHLPHSTAVQRVLTPRGNGSWVDFQVSHRADIDLSRTLHADSILFLRDGVHFFATVN